MNQSLAIKSMLAFAGIATAALFQITPGSKVADLPPLKTGRMTGTALPIFNSAPVYAGIQRGLAEQEYRLFRFPNGSLSNEYHWNGAGTYDSVGIWHPDPTKVAPGFQSNTKYRGTTKSNYGASFYSNITDGSDSTFWWSDSLSGAEPWVVLHLTSCPQRVDSVRIVWGSLRPDSVLVGALHSTGWNPYRAMDGKLAVLARAQVADSVSVVKLDSGASCGLVVKPVGVKPRGVQIAEIHAWAKGAQITTNTPSQTKQTQVTAMGTHPGSVLSKEWGGTGLPPWTFAMFTEYIKQFPGSEAQITVNTGTGTPAEAAAWVKYANIDQKMGIRIWQVGNESDGAWEEGGPVDARQYAAQFIAYARAMKAVDPSILVLGPVMSTADFATNASGHLDGTTWTEEVLRLVGEAEVKDGKRYLDGFDFHSYPYWTPEPPTPVAALAAVRGLKKNLDSLDAMMKRRLQDPGTRLVSMSEYNISVISMDLMMRPENTAAMAIMLSQLIETFGGNALSVLWDSYEGSGGNPDGSAAATWGSLTMFSMPRSGTASSFSYAPNSPYWGNWMISKLWAIDSAKPLLLTNSGTDKVEAHALVNGSDTSYILINPAAAPCSVQVALSKGWIYSFSKANYAWNGTTDQAFAFPNSGASGRPIPASWDGKLELPAFGIAVVRTSAPNGSVPQGQGHLVQFSALKHELESGDTLKVSGTIRRAPDAPAPVARIGDTTLTLPALDGSWDSPEEAFLLQVPVDALPLGSPWLRIGDRDSLRLSITNKVRPISVIDRFEDNNLNSDQPSKARWGSYTEGETPSYCRLSYVPRATGGQAQRTTTYMLQPENLGYVVFCQSNLALDSALVSNSIGIRFDYASTHDSGGRFNLQIETDTVTNYDDYLVKLPSTDSAWRTITVRWSEFQQDLWGKVYTGPLVARHINKLGFRIFSAGRGSIWLDNIVLLGTSGDSVNVGRSLHPRATSWSVLRAKDGWNFQLPAGAKLTLVGLDGRRFATWEAKGTEESVRFQPASSNVLFAIYENKGQRETRILPSIH
ncbi:MAG: hypothetical protein IPK50_06915 [Fibrobacterota bacterium]|nr:hypothetical protein [Fibrobacterota bacterium]QQS06624.1 MAG: hypothetical protein IPK50_06915 [Fibrobacterota bacterium]